MRIQDEISSIVDWSRDGDTEVLVDGRLKQLERYRAVRDDSVKILLARSGCRDAHFDTHSGRWKGFVDDRPASFTIDRAGGITAIETEGLRIPYPDAQYAFRKNIHSVTLKAIQTAQNQELTGIAPSKTSGIGVVLTAEHNGIKGSYTFYPGTHPLLLRDVDFKRTSGEKANPDHSSRTYQQDWKCISAALNHDGHTLPLNIFALPGQGASLLDPKQSHHFSKLPPQIKPAAADYLGYLETFETTGRHELTLVTAVHPHQNNVAVKVGNRDKSAYTLAVVENEGKPEQKITSYARMDGDAVQVTSSNFAADIEALSYRDFGRILDHVSSWLAFDANSLLERAKSGNIVLTPQVKGRCFALCVIGGQPRALLSSLYDPDELADQLIKSAIGQPFVIPNHCVHACRSALEPKLAALAKGTLEERIVSAHLSSRFNPDVFQEMREEAPEVIFAAITGAREEGNLAAKCAALEEIITKQVLRHGGFNATAKYACEILATLPGGESAATLGKLIDIPGFRSEVVEAISEIRISAYSDALVQMLAERAKLLWNYPISRGISEQMIERFTAEKPGSHEVLLRYVKSVLAIDPEHLSIYQAEEALIEYEVVHPGSVERALKELVLTTGSREPTYIYLAEWERLAHHGIIAVNKFDREARRIILEGREKTRNPEDKAVLLLVTSHDKAKAFDKEASRAIKDFSSHGYIVVVSEMRDEKQIAQEMVRHAHLGEEIELPFDGAYLISHASADGFTASSLKNGVVTVDHIKQWYTDTGCGSALKMEGFFFIDGCSAGGTNRVSWYLHKSNIPSALREVFPHARPGGIIGAEGIQSSVEIEWRDGVPHTIKYKLFNSTIDSFQAGIGGGELTIA